MAQLTGAVCQGNTKLIHVLVAHTDPRGWFTPRRSRRWTGAARPRGGGWHGSCSSRR
jgi:hypothetical protein